MSNRIDTFSADNWTEREVTLEVAVSDAGACSVERFAINGNRYAVEIQPDPLYPALTVRRDEDDDCTVLGFGGIEKCFDTQEVRCFWVTGGCSREGPTAATAAARMILNIV